jgi:multiple sugar transport system ATP-binding protein
VASIKLENLRKSFGKVEVVAGFNLEIESGAFVSLLGPSGCGKTTLLRMLAGLETPDDGTIRIDGQPVNNVAPGKRDIAMVFQSYALYPQMTVAQNIAYPLRKRGVAKADRASKVADVVAMLRLEPLLHRKPRELSGGQQQRVALGRALVREPRIFLLDEPLSNLDATLRTHMRGELVELHQRIGKTMVYVTHDQLEAMTMSTHIAVIDGGVLQQFGTPADVYRRPANRMVASFIGTPAMAFVEGEAALVDGTPSLTLAGQVIATLETLPSVSKVTVGIRAEDICIGTQGIPAQISLVEPVGHETIIRLDMAAGTVTARAGADADWKRGMAVRFLPTAHRLHLFDQASGNRIELGARSPFNTGVQSTPDHHGI